MRIGINGFGRMGRLTLRAGLPFSDRLEFVAINEPPGVDNDTLALLLEMDSVQGRLGLPCSAVEGGIAIEGAVHLQRLQESTPSAIPWRQRGAGVDVVLESSGRFRTRASVMPHLEIGGAQKVLVSAPMKDRSAPDIVVGVNDREIDFGAESVITAASCTTNCLAPIVRVLQDTIGIERGLVTTIHNPTNTQLVTDGALADPRRARSALQNLIPTSTNSATAVARIIPELAGKLDSVAVRAPVLNASITDCVFQVSRSTTIEEVHEVLATASTGSLQGILGVETRPLVSSDFVGDPRSAVVDAQSTRVTDGTLVKVMAWYDNEWGYANRLVDLLLRLADVV